MPSEDEDGPRDRPFLILSVLGICFSGFVLGLITVIYLFQGLCETVPEGRTYCNNSTESLNGTSITEGVAGYGLFLVLALIAVLFDLCAIVLASWRIYCCVKHFCVPCAATIWELCHCCGNCWYAMVGISVFLNLIGFIAVCLTVPISDLMEYITGFRYGLANLLTGFIKIILWTVYSKYRGSCCPHTDYFLGSTMKISDVYIKTTRVTTTRRSDGTIVNEHREDLGTRRVN